MTGAHTIDVLMADACTQFRAYLASGGDATGVICFNEVIAHGVYRAAADHGLHVPRDLSIIGFDDFHAIFATPPMTVVSHMMVKLGWVAGTTAMALADGTDMSDSRIPRQQIVPSELVVRASTASPVS